MKVLSRFRRRRWLVVLGCIAVAVPMAVSASSTASAGGQAAARPATPTIDATTCTTSSTRWRRASATASQARTAPPQDAADPFNLPPTVNGWQEL